MSEKQSQSAVVELDEPDRDEAAARGQTRGATDRRNETRTKRQPPYNVVIWNDETHSYEYVIELLIALFGHSVEKAFQITREVDLSGKGIAFTTHKELAELKRDQILAFGADWRMDTSTGPIRASIEPAPI